MFDGVCLLNICEECLLCTESLLLLLLSALRKKALKQKQLKRIFEISLKSFKEIKTVILPLSIHPVKYHQKYPLILFIFLM